MKRFLTVAVATVLASSLLVACSNDAAKDTSSGTSTAAQTEAPVEVSEAPVEEKELDADGLTAELTKLQENYEACAEAAKAAGDEEAYAAIGEQIVSLLDTVAEKGENLTQEDIDTTEAAIKEINEALEAYGGAVAESAADALNTLNQNIEAVDGYYAELEKFVDDAHEAGSLTDETYAQYKQYGNDLTSLGEAIGNALADENTTIDDVNAMSKTLTDVYDELQKIAEGVGAEVATIELVSAAAEEAAAQQAEADAAALEEAAAAEADAAAEEGEADAAAEEETEAAQG